MLTSQPRKWARQPPRISSMLSLRLEQKKLPFLFLYPSHKVLASSWQFPISHWELAPAGNSGFLEYWVCSWFFKYSWDTMITFVTEPGPHQKMTYLYCTWDWWVGWNSPLCIWLVLSVKLFFYLYLMKTLEINLDMLPLFSISFYLILQPSFKSCLTMVWKCMTWPFLSSYGHGVFGQVLLNKENVPCTWL